jgi:hypothetical protein
MNFGNGFAPFEDLTDLTPILNSHLPITNYQLPITNYQFVIYEGSDYLAARRLFES